MGAPGPVEMLCGVIPLETQDSWVLLGTLVPPGDGEEGKPHTLRPETGPGQAAELAPYHWGDPRRARGMTPPGF